MSVAQDLSSEIAAAILVRSEENGKAQELKEVVLRVHCVLQKLTTQCREQNCRAEVSLESKRSLTLLVYTELI